MGRTGRAALTLLPDVGLTLAALLIGWGLDDVPGFFCNPARMALVVAVIVSYVARTLLGIEFHPLRKGNRTGRRWPIVAGMSMVPVLWGILSFWDRRGIFVFPDLAAIRYAGVVAYACGEIVRLWALHELGRQYSAFITIQPEHKLV